MALISCHECLTPISDTAPVCPQCGARSVKSQQANNVGIIAAAVVLVPLLLTFLYLVRDFKRMMNE